MNLVNGSAEAVNNLERVVFINRAGQNVSAREVKEAAERLHIEHLRATVDSTFKKLFLYGIEENRLSVNRSLLIRTVKLLTEKGCSNDDITRPTEDENEQLNQYDIDLGANGANAMTLVQETLTKAPKSIKKDTLRVDFAAKVTMKQRQGERKSHCVFGVEVQVENNLWNPISTRQRKYCNSLSRIAAERSTEDAEDKRVYALKVFGSAICMWDNQHKPDALVLVKGIERDEFYSPSQNSNNSVFYKDMPYPVCCAQIFLGKWVDVLKKSTATANEANEAAGYAVVGYESIRKERQASLIKKFQGTFGQELGMLDIKDLREHFKNKIPQDKKQYGEISGGLSEADLPDDSVEREYFRILESYELLEFFLLGNLTTEKGVEEEVISNSVRNLYMDTRVTINNIVSDEEQASSIWYADELEKKAAELEKSQKENAELKAKSAVTGLLFNCIMQGKGELPHTEIEDLVPDKEVRERTVSNLVSEYGDKINVTEEGDIRVTLPQPTPN